MPELLKLILELILFRCCVDPPHAVLLLLEEVRDGGAIDYKGGGKQAKWTGSISVEHILPQVLHILASMFIAAFLRPN